jgi:hypothetical protein
MSGATGPRRRVWGPALAACLSLVFLSIMAAHAQEPPEPGSSQERAAALLRESRLAEAESAFAEWVAAESRNPDAHYGLALSRALQGRTAEAREGFLHVLALDPERADACFEIAAGFLTSQAYRQATAWVTKGLRLAPDDPFGLELAGTAYYLSGARTAALRYWNRLQRPHLSELRIVTRGGVTRQRVADEISLRPGDLLSWRELEKARWRLAQHRYITDVVTDPAPGLTPDEYALDLAVNGRRGIGSPAEFVFGTLADVGFQTLRFNYWNIAGSGVSLTSQWRWPPEARLLRVDLDIPRPLHVPVYSRLAFSGRDESWSLGAEGYGFRLRRTDIGMGLAFPVRLPEVSIAGSATGRRRDFDAPLGPGAPSDPAVAASRVRDARATGVLWLRAAPRIQLGEWQLARGWSVRSLTRASVDAGWVAGAGASVLSVSRLSAASDLRFARTAAGGRQQHVSGAFQAGTSSGPLPVEDHFVLGTGPDADFPLRAHPYLRNGRPGSTPMAATFVMGNVTVATDVKRWTWATLGVIGFADIGRAPTLYPGQDIAPHLCDTGIGVEFGSPVSSTRRFTFVWARDTVAGRSVFYVAGTLR